jgi:transposase InsO family protein
MAANVMVDGLEISKGELLDTFCESCVLGKQHRLSFPTSCRTRAKKVGELIHSDVCGPVSILSPGGAKYFVTFKDDFSGYCVIIFIQKKSEVFLLFQQLVKRVETEIGNPVVTLRSDNGGEYVGNDIEKWTLDHGIRPETSALYTPEKNGVAKRVNRTILESACSMLHSSSLPLELWAEACNGSTPI